MQGSKRGGERTVGQYTANLEVQRTSIACLLDPAAKSQDYPISETNTTTRLAYQDRISSWQFTIGFEKGELPLQHMSNFLNRSHAHQCALWYCVQAYKVAVNRGELRDEVIDALHDAREIEGGFVFDKIPVEYNVEPDDVYEVRSVMTNTIQRWFNLTTEAVLWDDYDGFFTLMEKWNRTGGDLIAPFWTNFDDLDPWIGRVAASLSNMLRSIQEDELSMEQNKSEASQKRYRGTVFIDQVTLHVRWVWMIYLGILVLLAVAFLSIQIAHATGRGDVRSWKDDPFALLWLQIDEELKEKLRDGLDDPAGFERAVGKYRVQVSRDGNGLPSKLHLKED
ncbi:hypothetical protein CC79DRAFT_1326494 [Sarocladium strictum]